MGKSSLMLLYVHRDHEDYWGDRQPRMTISTFTQFLSLTVPRKQHFVAVVVFKLYFRGEKILWLFTKESGNPPSPLYFPPPVASLVNSLPSASPLSWRLRRRT